MGNAYKGIKGRLVDLWINLGPILEGMRGAETVESKAESKHLALIDRKR